MATQVFDDIGGDSGSDESVALDRGKVLAFLEGDGQKYDLYEGDNIIGRSINKDLDVKLLDTSVSDVHANLELSEAGECYCKDLASNNGKINEH
jgi:FHA domain